MNFPEDGSIVSFSSIGLSSNLIAQMTTSLFNRYCERVQFYKLGSGYFSNVYGLTNQKLTTDVCSCTNGGKIDFRHPKGICMSACMYTCHCCDVSIVFCEVCWLKFVKSTTKSRNDYNASLCPC